VCISLLRIVVKIPPAVESSWKDVSGRGCGFAMATSESGKLITCGSTNDLGQSYVTSGKHCETPEPFPLPPEVCVQKAEAGWDHCVAVGNDNSGNDMQGSGAVKKTYTTDGVMCEQLCRSEHRWQRYYCYYYIV
ncbi:unnamed protein product, partial [Brassica oleracea]